MKGKEEMEAGVKFGHARVTDKKWQRWKTEQKLLSTGLWSYRVYGTSSGW